MTHNGIEHLHREERRQFERLMGQMGVGRVGDRLAVLEAFLAIEDHQTAEEVERVLAQHDQRLEPEFVADTLELLNQLGLASRRQFDGQPARYEHRHLGEHHDHLICLKCGSISEFHDPGLEALKEQAAQERGFHQLSHRLQIYGLCQKCLATREPSLPLALASPGEKLVVTRLTGGHDSRQHLADLGITLGTELEVLSSGGGPMVVAVRGSRLALGRGVTNKVLVAPARRPGPA